MSDTLDNPRVRDQLIAMLLMQQAIDDKNPASKGALFKLSRQTNDDKEVLPEEITE